MIINIVGNESERSNLSRMRRKRRSVNHGGEDSQDEISAHFLVCLTRFRGERETWHLNHKKDRRLVETKQPEIFLFLSVFLSSSSFFLNPHDIRFHVARGRRSR